MESPFIPVTKLLKKKNLTYTDEIITNMVEEFWQKHLLLLQLIFKKKYVNFEWTPPPPRKSLLSILCMSHSSKIDKKEESRAPGWFDLDKELLVMYLVICWPHLFRRRSVRHVFVYQWFWYSLSRFTSAFSDSINTKF